MSTAGKIARGASTRIVTYPVRVLIIINSVLFPLLLGVIIFLIMKFTKPVMDVITKAKSIEKLVEDNIHLGINKAKEIFNVVTGFGEKMYTEFITTLSHIVEETVFNYQDPADTQTQTLLDLLEVDFKTEIATQFQTFFEQPDHFLEFIERNDSINGMIDHIIEKLNKRTIDTNTKINFQDDVIKVLNEIKSHNYSIIGLFTHSELLHPNTS